MNENLIANTLQAKCYVMLHKIDISKSEEFWTITIADRSFGISRSIHRNIERTIDDSMKSKRP